jgi:putative protease
MANRDSNRGMCCHPCRWKYAVVEELRPGQYMPLAEDDRGTYIFNSKDLCMVEHIPKMIESGIASFKIEGRMKGINYLASTVKIYREAIDAYYKNPVKYITKAEWIHELSKISNRDYCTGFYLGYHPKDIMKYDQTKSSTGYTFIGKVLNSNGRGKVDIEVRNKIFVSDIVEILVRKGPARPDKISRIFKKDGQILSLAQPGEIVTIELNQSCAPNSLIRRVEVIRH